MAVFVIWLARLVSKHAVIFVRIHAGCITACKQIRCSCICQVVCWDAVPLWWTCWVLPRLSAMTPLASCAYLDEAGESHWNCKRIRHGAFSELFECVSITYVSGEISILFEFSAHIIIQEVIDTCPWLEWDLSVDRHLHIQCWSSVANNLRQSLATNSWLM